MRARRAAEQAGLATVVVTREAIHEKRSRRHPMFVVGCWYLLLVVIVGAAGALAYSATVLHLDPPVVPVVGSSMQPMLGNGDLVVLEPVKPSQLRVGEVVALHVPSIDRSKDTVPANIVQRIAGIDRRTNGLMVTTTSDNSAGRVVIRAPGTEVIGKLRFEVPWLGFPALFIQSTQGRILLVAIGLVALLSLLFGLFDKRREYVLRSFQTMWSAVSGPGWLERFLAQARLGAPSSPEVNAATLLSPLSAGHPTTMMSSLAARREASATAATDAAPTSVEGQLGIPPVARRASRSESDADHAENEERALDAARDRAILEQLERAVADQRATNEEVARSLRSFGDAVSAYAVHLQSHTAVMQNLAAVTGDLRKVVSDLDRRLEDPPREVVARRDAPVAEVAPGPLAGPAVHEPPEPDPTEHRAPGREVIESSLEPPYCIQAELEFASTFGDLELEARDPEPDNVEQATALSDNGASECDRVAPAADASLAGLAGALGTAEHRSGVIASTWDLERWAAYEEWCLTASDVPDPDGDDV